MSDDSTALAPIDAAAIALPTPRYTGAQMIDAMRAYKDLQRALDAEMPDQLQTIGDGVFRCKGYWRAVGVAFDIELALVAEQRVVHDRFTDNADNFGYVVTYQATRGARSVPGDGACFAIEKADRFRCPHPVAGRPGYSEHYPHTACPSFDPDYRRRMLPEQASEHNVRSHAHTRAMNRAISNFCGFGEVSAEEVEPPPDDERVPQQPTHRSPTPQHRRAPATAMPISEPQRKRLWAIAHKAGWNETEVKSLLGMHGFEHDRDVTRDKYDTVCDLLDAGPDGTREHVR